MDDRLVAVEDDQIGTVAGYYYDPFGRRLWKEVDGVRTYFVYCDEGLVGEYDASGVELRIYGWAPNSQWSTDPLFVKIGSQYYWYQNDHLGTPQKIITGSGLGVWSATYDSFGNADIEVEAITNNLRFPGQYFDAETGLYYNLNRYYDPRIGRYLRTDPFGEGLNLYAYVFNNPLSLIDPLGLCAVRDLGYYLGTGFGEEAAMWYAERYNATGNPIYFAGGLFASLWTPETYAQTAITLATAPLAAARIAAAGTKSAAAAARAAMKEVVEEVIGVPLPTKPKFHSRSGGQILEGATWDKIAIASKNLPSTLRQTTPGEKFLRYESGHPRYSKVTPEGGLKPGTYTAPGSEGVLPKSQLPSRYNLPDPQIPRSTYYEVTPPAGTWVEGPKPVMGGTGSEVVFPYGTPPGSVGPAIPAP